MKYFVYSIFLLGCCQVKTAENTNSENTNSESNKPSVIEIIGQIDDEQIELLRDVSNDQVFVWKDHAVIYGGFKSNQIDDQFRRAFTENKLKIYEEPLYNFQKNVNCENKQVADEWKHYILTANLVADTIKQNEYLKYHQFQFEQWPEVAHGFCNAGFQQLLVFKNDRQLMLVISIPANNTLDELNPRTTENNPRMDEWNTIMGQYQEGIPGTAAGEVWVFLDQI